MLRITMSSVFILLTAIQGAEQEPPNISKKGACETWNLAWDKRNTTIPEGTKDDLIGPLAVQDVGYYCDSCGTAFEAVEQLLTNINKTDKCQLTRKQIPRGKKNLMVYKVVKDIKKSSKCYELIEGHQKKLPFDKISMCYGFTTEVVKDSKIVKKAAGKKTRPRNLASQQETNSTEAAKTSTKPSETTTTSGSSSFVGVTSWITIALLAIAMIQLANYLFIKA